MSKFIQVRMVLENRNIDGRPYTTTAPGLIRIDQIESLTPAMQYIDSEYKSTVKIKTTTGNTITVVGYVSEFEKTLLGEEEAG